MTEGSTSGISWGLDLDRLADPAPHGGKGDLSGTGTSRHRQGLPPSDFCAATFPRARGAPRPAGHAACRCSTTSATSLEEEPEIQVLIFKFLIFQKNDLACWETACVSNETYLQDASELRQQAATSGRQGSRPYGVWPRPGLLLGSPSRTEWAAGPGTPRLTPAPLVPGVGDALPEELNCHLLWSCLPSLALMGWKQRRQ